jgi:hypothetical protein
MLADGCFKIVAGHHRAAGKLKAYYRKHGGLMEAHNRLAGIIALCEQRIGQELRTAPKNRGGAEKGVGRAGKNALQDEEGIPPKLGDLGITYNQSAAYQELADVEENVLLDAVTAAGAEGREVTKRDIQAAARAEIDRQRAARGEPPA